MEIILVKLGGSIITDKETPYTARIENINRLATEIAAALQANPTLKLIIANGSGSFGHAAANERNITKKGIDASAAEYIREAADKINNIVLGNLVVAGIKAKSIKISDWTEMKNGKVHLDEQNIEQCIENGFIPLLHGDVIKDDVKDFSILSGEGIFAAIIDKWQPIGKHKIKKIIMVGEVDGVLNSRSEVIADVNGENFDEVKQSIASTKGADVTGGMLHKIETSLKIAAKGIETLIISGKEDVLRKALLGEEVLGTRIIL